MDASLAAGTTMYIENASRHHIIDAAPPRPAELPQLVSHGGYGATTGRLQHEPRQHRHEGVAPHPPGRSAAGTGAYPVGGRRHPLRAWATRNAQSHCRCGARAYGVRQDLHVAAQASKVALHVALPATPGEWGRKTAAVGHALDDTLLGEGPFSGRFHNFRLRQRPWSKQSEIV